MDCSFCGDLPWCTAINVFALSLVFFLIASFLCLLCTVKNLLWAYNFFLIVIIMLIFTIELKLSFTWLWSLSTCACSCEGFYYRHQSLQGFGCTLWETYECLLQFESHRLRQMAEANRHNTVGRKYLMRRWACCSWLAATWPFWSCFAIQDIQNHDNHRGMLCPAPSVWRPWRCGVWAGFISTHLVPAGAAGPGTSSASAPMQLVGAALTAGHAAWWKPIPEFVYGHKLHVFKPSFAICR